MNENEAKNLLKKLNFTQKDIDNLEVFKSSLLQYNNKYNLISKSTERSIWSRHILDSAQLIKFFSMKSHYTLADLGSGAGFPGLVIAIFNKNPEFHVKLYEKSQVKRDFLNSIKKKLNINVEIKTNIYDEIIKADYVTSRAFKKLEQVLKISREMIKKPHELIILKGRNAQDEINNVSLNSNYSYNLENSITDVDSKIILIKAR
jgi:16S rRNA (guanine527-N7)-methyltransferase